MANIRIPQYERKVQLNANQSPAVRLAEPIPEPDYGKAIQQAGAAIASIGSSVNAIGNKLQKQNFALIEADRDAMVKEVLTKAAQGTVKEENGATVHSYGYEQRNADIEGIDKKLKGKYGDFFTQWQASIPGRISQKKFDEAFGNVLAKKLYDHKMAALDSTLENKINNVFLTGEDVSGENFNQDINGIVDSYKDTLSERDLQNTRNRAAGRAYALYVDKTINRGNQKDVEALIERLKAYNAEKSEPENFKYMQAEDRAKYIEFLGRAKNAMQGTALESNADNLLKRFFTYVEKNSVVTTKNGQKIPAANGMLELARNYPETFCRRYNISRRQLTTLTNVMEQVLAGSPQGAAASMDLERFDVRWKMIKDDDKTKMSTIGQLYGVLREKEDTLEWGATKTDQNKIKKILTEMETTAALIAQDGVKAQYTTPWYDFAHQTNDEYIKSELPGWIKSMTVQEEISDEMLGQAYLYAYEFMERNDKTLKLSTAESRQALQSDVKAYLSQMIKGLNNNVPDDSKLNMPKYQKYQIPEGLPDRKSYLKE